MLKLLHLGAALAAVLSTQVTDTSIARISKDISSQGEQATTHNLVAINTNVADTTNSIVTADSGNDILEETQKVDPVLLSLAAVGGGIAVAVSTKKAKQPFKLNSRSEGTIRIEQANGKLRKKLMRLLHDDRETANRLLSQAKLKHPNKSVDWYADKVIYDLERDRGSY
ncbi:MAG TPA: hypothetical protein V6D09_03785 [Leptolyngbyaceae cyanobacterium]